MAATGVNSEHVSSCRCSFIVMCVETWRHAEALVELCVCFLGVTSERY